MTEDKPKDFNKAAANWDEKPRRRQLAAAVANSIAATLPLQKGMNALEYGCGTGLVGLQLAEKLGHLTAADTAQGMLLELRKKARSLDLDNITPLLVPADRSVLPEAGFDLVFCSMVLHHIEDTAGILKQFHYTLAPQGYLALADLDQEDGTFHDNPQGIAHNGFDRDLLTQKLEQLGFVDITNQIIHTVHKDREEGNSSYPVFLITGKKP